MLWDNFSLLNDSVNQNVRVNSEQDLSNNPFQVNHSVNMGYQYFQDNVVRYQTFLNSQVSAPPELEALTTIAVARAIENPHTWMISNIDNRTWKDISFSSEVGIGRQEPRALVAPAVSPLADHHHTTLSKQPLLSSQGVGSSQNFPHDDHVALGISKP